MRRQPGELVPIGEVIADLPGAARPLILLSRNIRGRRRDASISEAGLARGFS